MILLTFLSTYVQSLESSIEGLIKLGQVKKGQDYFLMTASQILDTAYYLTYLQCVIGHQGPSWTTDSMHAQ